MNILLGYIFTYLYLILVLVFAYIISKKTKNPELPRKLIHIFVGFSWFIMVYFFKTSYHLIIPPLSFIFINYISYTKNIIKPLERAQNNTPGHVYYAISFTILAFLTYLHPELLPYYGLGVLAMALGDGIAPFASCILNYPIGHTHKTYAGSITVVIITILIAILFNNYFHLGFTFLKYLLLGVLACILELAGTNGKDNLYLPIGLALISCLF